MTPAINFVGGVIVGLVLGVGLCVGLFLFVGALGKAMGSHGRMHRANAFPVAIRVLRGLGDQINPSDRHDVDIAIGLMINDLKRQKD